MSESEDDLFDSAPIREDQRTNQISSFKISVSSAERRVEEKLGSKRDEVFTTYMVESLSNKTHRVWRRYTNFLQLRQYLEVEHPSCIIPPMPAKRTGDIWNQLTQDNFDPEFIGVRQMALERFLHRIKAQPILAADPIVYEFLTNEKEWNEKVEATDYQKRSASWLKQKKAHLNVKTEDSRIQEMKAYVEDLSEHLKGVLKTRIKIKEQIFASKHIASSFARVIGELSQVEVSVSSEVSALKAAYVEAAGEIEANSRAFSNYNKKENELSNDLTEYLMYCEAIKDLITRYEIVQCRQDGHTSKKRALEKEKYELESGGGKSFSAKGLKRAILGGGEHQRLQRIAELEVRIKDLEYDVKKLESTTASFVHSTSQQLEQFEWMKNHEIGRILRDISQLETEFNQESAEAWRRVEHCFKSPSIRNSSNSTEVA